MIEEAWGADTTYIGIHVDVDAIRKLQLELTMEEIRVAIVAAKKLKIKMHVSAIPPRLSVCVVWIAASDPTCTDFLLRAR